MPKKHPQIFVLIFFLSISLCLTSTIAYGGYWKSYDCTEFYGKTEYQDCVNEVFAKLDKKLNKLYQEIKSGLDVVGQEKLGLTQTFWLKYKEANLDFHGDTFYGGTYAVRAMSDRGRYMLRVRIKEFELYLKGITAQSSAMGIPDAPACLAKEKGQLDCLQAIYKKEDKKLNDVWNKFRPKKPVPDPADEDSSDYWKRMYKNITKNRKAAGNYWVQFRDADAEFYADTKRGKPEAKLIELLTKIRITRERRLELDEYYNWMSKI